MINSAPFGQGLAAWLAWQENLHVSTIDLGLERIAQVATRMQLLKPDFPIITVAGTNGKGSTVALLTSILQSAGYQVGSYTSPHILHYNERITLNSLPVEDSLLVKAFTAIELAREQVSLSYFEFGTLAALWIFAETKVDVAVLEVGLGGRLDATNLWDADAAIITAIGIDHVEWLGHNREVIGREKAGIARAGKPLVCGDPNPPQSIREIAQEKGAQLLQLSDDFLLEPVTAESFSISLRSTEAVIEHTWQNLPRPSLQGQVQLNNAACAVVALHCLAKRLPRINGLALQKGILNATIAGRLQKLQSQPDVWIDVAHNPHAAENLANWLENNPIAGKTFVIFSILADKDIDGVIQSLRDKVDEWHIFPLDSPRAASLSTLESAFASVSLHNFQVYSDISHAWKTLTTKTASIDRVVIFGSFLVVSQALDGIF
ncbi:bifunctional tetrahydrofolate synthase/dihydrofolate synthase [uncultured Thiothrix sp.]|uniref:bifunctional tetrahydrofolate synthase/dihydrofolate synthase n=1 Tax=uncultured Thiothrix sp. TaxID=223185 RepID=UPI0026213E22|nr:bifunctional tetrahydrofolate synthase/dihydrofolate synthase [uncultured Thiothrix sp.]HMT92114.1 bifunctional tetrahydrofolate synthase/dihydrofolate synthase [Thiolinea sp.]